jgi:glycosyltransferase involved in cell wall biosynthesis
MFRYGLIFWVSDGSLPFLFSKNNLIHFQVPFKTIGGNTFINKIKTLFVHKFIYNSEFTAAVHETHLPKSKSFILYPPVDVESFKPGKKENIILSVARFDSPSHSKRQDVLIDAFKILNKNHPEYQLFLVGGSKGESDTLDILKEKSASLPVKFIVNPDFDKLKALYAKSKYFWHAAGFGIDDSKEPEKVEHFGMTTVEAMAAGCIPIVLAKGGQKEIVSKGSGVLFSDIDELAKQTESLIKNPELGENYAQSAIERSKKYSLESFFQKIASLI